MKIAMVSESAHPPEDLAAAISWLGHEVVHLAECSEDLARRWKADRPDVVHAHGWAAGLASLRAAEPSDLPVVQTFRALGTVERRHRGDAGPPGRIEREAEIANQCARIIATSEDEIAELAAMGVPEAKVALIPSGVDLDRFNPIGESAHLGSRYQILAAGSLTPRKGFDVPIRALAGLPHTELVIAGGPAEGATDEDLRRLRELAVESDVSGRVRLPGHVPHEAMPTQFRAAHVVVCTPWYEPFGAVALEAMACGIPVVAGAVGALKDAVEDGVTGTLVPDPTPESLAAAVRPYLEDSDLQRMAGQAGRLRVCSRYAWDAIAAETWKAYEQAVDAA